MTKTALIVIDVQRGFESPTLGRRNNPDCETNVRALLDGWLDAGQPVVLVRHDSVSPDSVLAPGQPGNAFKPELDGVRPDLLVPKSVHSAFHGEVDLHAWLTRHGIRDLVVCGIQTNRCVETTSRVGGDLGYRVRVALDATHTFDEQAPDGTVVTAEEFTRATATNLHGHFAEVTTTAAVLAALQGAGS
ncbi:cysteine hydrolase family protein [Streptoalloteichus hindustanus]|uniref:Nicotinamidase-related amidase n=1 Tax=Streptoalloteichus hindustanus TaxID=2017 RepID=A0A1M5GC47_STRHI|nr:cysteine hydrolase family protein [Streptoalloteichus hindustanus]SHG01266.1 Nicotinamidase-related amidase [Streptoalloteichus hindustanus]